MIGRGRPHDAGDHDHDHGAMTELAPPTPPAFPPPDPGDAHDPAAAHDPTPGRRRGPLVTLACVSGVAAIALGSIALLGGDADDEVVLDVTDVIADEPPVTIPPVPIETLAEPTPDERLANDPEGPNSTTASDDAAGADPELSPLAELLGPRYSAVPEEIEPRPRPVGVRSDAIDIERFPIRAVGLEDDGQLEIPDETEIGWYQYGATAGRPGATVLAAHVSWNNTTGPFFRLGTMEPGDRLTVALDDGSSRDYEVIERTMYDKDSLPRNRIWRNTGLETLVLITCGGDFNPDIRRYRQNIVVYAVPVASTAPVSAS